jgi:uncharacterized protein (DUF2147 family)
MMRLLLIVLMMLGMSTAYASGEYDPVSPVGDWKTVDDVSGKVLAVIQIKELPDHTLSGTLIKTYPQPGSNDHVCSKCDPSDPRYNKPILGMRILTGFKHNGDSWGEGEILDPKKGAVYRCKIHVVDNGKKLNVRGYVLFPMLGRTQTWIRED